MVTAILMLLGFTTFLAGVIALGAYLRRNPSKPVAEKTSRITQFLYFAGMVAPGVIGIVYPGLNHFDELFGIPPLPVQPIPLALGIILLLPGLYLLAVSNQALRSLGSGANAFILTKQVVNSNIYERTRNPMSLGYYLVNLAVVLIAGSTILTVGCLLVLIPLHIFYLKYFEELELELRLAESYLEYKRRVPFLIPR